MSSAELDRLARIGQLKQEPPMPGEVEGLSRSGESRLRDAPRPELSYPWKADSTLPTTQRMLCRSQR
jgi:hypothetical protein